MYIKLAVFFLLLCSQASASKSILDYWIREGGFPSFSLDASLIERIRGNYSYQEITKTGEVIGCISHSGTKYFFESNRFGPAGVSTIVGLRGEESMNCEEAEIDKVTLEKIEEEISLQRNQSFEESFLSEFGSSLVKNSVVLCLGKSRVLERGQSQMVRGWTGCAIKGQINGFVISFIEASG